MIIGKVVGTVVSSRKNCNLVGSKFLIVDPLKDAGFSSENRVVAVDNVGAGIGEIVLLAFGSAARIGCNMENASIDCAIVGIVDNESNIFISK